MDEKLKRRPKTKEEETKKIFGGKGEYNNKSQSISVVYCVVKEGNIIERKGGNAPFLNLYASK